VEIARASDPDPRLGITSGTEDGVCLIELRGEIDQRTAPLVTAELEGVLAGGVHAVVLDLCQVSFMDSRGLWVLIRARRAFSRHNVTFALACPPDGAPGRLLALTGLRTAFTIHASSAEALDTVFGPGRPRLEDGASRISDSELTEIERRLERLLDELEGREPLVPPDTEALG
jgi:anti-sigma B factor antagonist